MVVTFFLLLLFRKIEKVVADKTFKTHRNNSYANAIEGDPVVELSYQVLKWDS